MPAPPGARAPLDAPRPDPPRGRGRRRARLPFVEAEAAVRDPLEGEPFEETDFENSAKPAGPVRSRVREVLGA